MRRIAGELNEQTSREQSVNKNQEISYIDCKKRGKLGHTHETDTARLKPRRIRIRFFRYRIFTAVP